MSVPRAWLLSLLILLPAAAAEVRPVEPAPAEPIEWQGRARVEIFGKRIAGPASIRLRDCSDVTITACDLGSIELRGCRRVAIRNCRVHDSARCGIELYDSDGVTVQGCRLERVATGVYAVDSRAVQVVGNYGRDMVGPFPRGQLAQFDHVTGPGNAVRGNYAVNAHGTENHEDAINIYMSEGTAGSPIVVEDNYVAGDPALGSADMSKTGSGIMLGDCGGAYIVCRRNVVVSGGQVGMGVAGGRFVRVEDNVIYGRRSNVANVGLYAWNQSKRPAGSVTIARNRVKWTNKDGQEASWWNGGGFDVGGGLTQRDNRFADAGLPARLPPPPSRAPMPPRPWTDAAGAAPVPWAAE